MLLFLHTSNVFLLKAKVSRCRKQKTHRGQWMTRELGMGNGSHPERIFPIKPLFGFDLIGWLLPGEPLTFLAT